MQFGITMFPTDYSISPQELATEVEARGYESLWFPEHSHIPTSRKSPWPGGPELPKWYYDTYDQFLALTAAVIVAGASMLAGSTALETAQRFGAGFWDLVAFTMQMSMIIVTGYAVATAPPVYAMIRSLAKVPTTGPGAAAYVGLFSMLASLVSWSFSLIFSGLLAREVTHRVRGADYRAVGAAAYLGVGSVWALGLSSSAALIMAAPASLPDAIEKISGVIPLSQTLGLWHLDAGAGTSAADASGNGRVGTLVNAPAWVGDTPFIP